ncbi:MAG: hypothetical protein IJV22_08385 [Bacteroidales bacterium]|nr:hypothetical protein [Bacteroidales bacterium]
MYVFDYEAPIGYRLAMWHPERITAIISQNGNMYEEGLGKKWEARKAYWKNPTNELRQQFSSAFALETIIGQYTFGTPEGSVGPDGYSLDYYYACQAVMRYRTTSYSTTDRTWPSIPSSRTTCAPISPTVGRLG